MKKILEHKNKIFIVLFTLFTFAIIGWSVDGENYEEIEEEPVVKEETKVKEKEKKIDKLFVDIKGQINKPGVYELTSKNNVNDAIIKAGGLTKQSDTSNINLSKKLTDEMVIIVYSKEEIKKLNEKTEDKKETTCPPCNDACIKKEDEKANIITNKTLTKEKESQAVNSKININTASEEELTKITGIGEAKAKSIIEYRKSQGKFEKIDDIKNVSGIGEAAYEKIKDQITI